MIESLCSSFFNSDFGEGGEETSMTSECSMDPSDNMDLTSGDTEPLFSSLLDNKSVGVGVNDLSGTDSDDMFEYLSGITTRNSCSLSESKSPVDVIDVCGDQSVTETSGTGTITLFGKDLLRECSVEQKQRSRPSLMSSGPMMVVKLPRVDAKFPAPVKYRTAELPCVDKTPSNEAMFSDSNNCSKCMSRNAITARQMRERKKKYVQELEHSVDTLRKEKNEIESKYNKQSSHVKSLEKEVQYLRNVIANQSTIGALLNNIHKTPGITISSSLKLSNKRKSVDENNVERKVNGVYPSMYVRTSSRSKKLKENIIDEDPDAQSSTTTQDELSGVCLHVANNHVSLEFCAQCAGSASGARLGEANSDACAPLKVVKANNITRNRC